MALWNATVKFLIIFLVNFIERTTTAHYTLGLILECMFEAIAFSYVKSFNGNIPHFLGVTCCCYNEVPPHKYTFATYDEFRNQTGQNRDNWHYLITLHIACYKLFKLVNAN